MPSYCICASSALSCHRYYYTRTRLFEHCSLSVLPSSCFLSASSYHHHYTPQLFTSNASLLPMRIVTPIILIVDSTFSTRLLSFAFFFTFVLFFIFFFHLLLLVIVVSHACVLPDCATRIYSLAFVGLEVFKSLRSKSRGNLEPDECSSKLIGFSYRH